MKNIFDKASSYWGKKLKKISEDGNISHTYEFIGLIQQIWSFYPKQSTDSMKLPSKYQYNYLQNLKRLYSILYGNINDPG